MANFGTASRSASQCLALSEVRQEIDRVDRQLVPLLAERMSYIHRAGVLKTDRGAVHDDTRIEEVVAKVQREAEANGLDPHFAESLWRELMRLSIAHEFVVYDSKCISVNNA